MLDKIEALEEKLRSRLVWRCVECGSEKLLVSGWAPVGKPLSVDEMIELGKEESWCLSCDAHTDIIAVPEDALSRQGKARRPVPRNPKVVPPK